MGYPEPNEGSPTNKTIQTANQTELNETNTSGANPVEVNTTSLNLNQTEQNNQTASQNPNLMSSEPLQESLIGDVLSDILEFISNLIQTIREFFSI